MSDGKTEENTMNEGRSKAGIDTQVTRGRSGPVPYEVVDYRGKIHGPFRSVIEAFAYADAKWPDQEQDEDRTGQGWDVQVVGYDS
jgi:hypothetical protein